MTEIENVSQVFTKDTVLISKIHSSFWVLGQTTCVGNQEP